MNTVNRKTLISQFLTHILAILVIVVISILSVPRGFENKFMFSWLAFNSIIIYLKYIIPITVTAFAICFSMLLRHADLIQLKSQSLFGVIRGALIFLFVFVLLYTISLYLLWPEAHRQKSLAEYRSELINTSIDQSKYYLNQENYLAANKELEKVFNLIPLHREGNELYQEVQTLMPETTAEIKPETPQAKLSINLEYNEITERAEQALAEQDYFSAVFYAQLALNIRTERDDPRVRRILSESLKKIVNANLSTYEESERELFYLKQSGAQAYHNTEYINAYYIFKEVESRNPLDPDALKYLEDIEPRIKNISFFIDEIDKANTGEIRKNVFIRIPSQEEREGRTVSQDRSFLSAEQILRNRTGVYLIDAEYLELGPDSSINRHIKIHRAKFSGTYLITQVITRSEQNNVYRHEYIQGSPDDDINIIDISITGDELWSLNHEMVHLNETTIAQLFDFFQLYPLFGKNPAFPQSEILYRLLLPFTLICSSLFIILIAWQGRSRYINGPPGYMYIFLPLIPLSIFIVFELYISALRNITTSILLLSNFTVALVLLVLFQGLLTLLILFMFTSQKHIS